MARFLLARHRRMGMIRNGHEDNDGEEMTIARHDQNIA